MRHSYGCGAFAVDVLSSTQAPPGGSRVIKTDANAAAFTENEGASAMFAYSIYNLNHETVQSL